jgi:hypothetical protein
MLKSTKGGSNAGKPYQFFNNFNKYIINIIGESVYSHCGKRDSGGSSVQWQEAYAPKHNYPIQ